MWGDPPKRVAGSARRVTLLSGVGLVLYKILANCLWRSFSSLKVTNRKPQHCKVAARAASESRRALTVIVGRLPAIFVLFTCLAAIQ